MWERAGGRMGGWRFKRRRRGDVVGERSGVRGGRLTRHVRHRRRVRYRRRDVTTGWR